MSDESWNAFEAWFAIHHGRYYRSDSGVGERMFEAWSARNAEITALKARVEELETRVIDLSVMIDKERLENGIEIVALKEKVRWFQANSGV